MNSTRQHSLQRVNYNRKRQLWLILKRYVARWFITAILLLGFIMTAEVFATFSTLVSIEKGCYNSLNIAFSLLVGMNTTNALSSIASDLRWYIMSLKPWNLPVTERILNIESLSSVVWLLFHKAGYQLKGFAFMWIFINIALQALIAVLALGLGFKEEFGYRSEPGEVLVGDLTEYKSPLSNRSLPLIEQQGLAQMFGVAGEFEAGPFERIDTFLELARKPGASAPDVLFSEDRRTAYYNFKNYNPDDRRISLPSDRQISTTANCSFFEVLSSNGQAPKNISVEMDGSVKSIQLPAEDFGNTIYFTDFSDDCGSRCAQISVYRPIRDGSDDRGESSYFECTTTVSKVANVTQDFEQVSDNVAKLAAASVALDGLKRGGNNIQYQLYPENTLLDDSLHGNTTAVEIALNVFALSSLMSLAELSLEPAIGKRPFFGSAIDTEWTLVIAVVMVIGGVQLLIALVAAFLASKVVIVENSIVSLSFIMDEIANDIRLSGIDNHKRSERNKKYSGHTGQKYRYGFVKARDGSDIDYNLTVKAANQSLQGGFPPGYYGIEGPDLQSEKPMKLSYGLKDGLPPGSTILHESNNYGLDVMVIP